MQITYDLSEIDRIAHRVLAESQHTIFLFYGMMGSGKTTLIKSMLKSLGVTETVSSPTFALVQEYSNTRNDRFYHFDLYRIQQAEEVLDIGFEEYVSDGEYLFIEWPEIITNYLPEAYTKIQLSQKNTQKRTLEMF